MKPLEYFYFPLYGILIFPPWMTCQSSPLDGMLVFPPEWHASLLHLMAYYIPPLDAALVYHR